MEHDIVYTDEKGAVRIVDGNVAPSGWYCECGDGHNYTVTKCSCKAMRER